MSILAFTPSGNTVAVTTRAGSLSREESLARIPQEIRAAIAALSARMMAHPFLVRCEQGRITMPELRSFLIQQGKYSRYFTRYLCALISNLADADDVLHLAENLSEELGFGDHGGVPHSRMYANMLKNFDIELDQEAINPETQNLIDSMLMLCRQSNSASGLGALCLGAEAIVPAMYAAVIKGFRSQGVPEKDLEFFSVHVECDDGHAETMYDILARLSAESRATLLTALAAGELAINNRLRFLDAIVEGA